MLLKSLFVLAILVFSSSAAILRRVGDSSNFTIGSKRYGHVHHYGVNLPDDLDLLDFSLTLSPAHFRFTSQNALQDVDSDKCVNRLSETNQQLLFTNNCDGSDVDKWFYNSKKEQLVNLNVGYCFSPWYYSQPPKDADIVPGLSQCADWNRIVLDPNPDQEDKGNLRS